MDSDSQAVHAELERVRRTFARHVEEMSQQDLRRLSRGTRWTNRQLLFHMLFGYLLVRNLLWMVKVLGRLPRSSTKPFAAVLDFSTPAFHRVNYFGSVCGGVIFTPARMQRRLDKVTAKLESDLDGQTEENLTRGMYYPTRWDPYFKRYMQLADIYHYPTQHFDHHDRQLSR
jgi:DinB superfamily